MRGYPVLLHLAGRSCLVVGGGRVGSEKVRGLIEAGATVLVVDPSPCPRLVELAASQDASRDASKNAIRIVQRRFHTGDLGGMLLAFACTADRDVNASVLAAAAERGILACDAGTGPSAAGLAPAFSGAAVLRRGELCVAVSTGGTAPLLAAKVRDRIAGQVGEEFAEAAALIGQLRERLMTGVEDAAARRRAIREVLDGGLVELLLESRSADAAALCDAVFDRARAGSGEQAGEPNRCIR